MSSTHLKCNANLICLCLLFLAGTGYAADLRPPTGGGSVLIGFSGNGKLITSDGALVYRDEDILRYNFQQQTWSMFFDGSDLGIRGDINAFSARTDGALLFSLEAPEQISDLGLIDDSDILLFEPESIGANTSGTLSVYFDGSDVGLSTSNEDIHALSMLDNGNLLISTNGNAIVPGLTVADEDLLEFSPTTLGAATTGTWSRFLDGSTVELAKSTEDIRAASLDGNNLHLVTLSTFAAGAVQGRSSDIFTCTLTRTAASTTCLFTLLAKGADIGSGSRAIDSIRYIPDTESVSYTHLTLPTICSV